MRVGKSPLEASVLAYGCWRIAGAATPGALTADQWNAGKAAVLAAYEAGYTLFDHADIYAQGAAEIIFGRALREAPEMRDRVLIATKCGIRFSGDPTPEAPYRYDFSAEHILRSCEGSLKRLGVGTIDLYILHRPDFLCRPEEVAAAFEKLRGEGKARAFGVSNFTPSQVSLLQQACPFPLAVNQIECSLLHLDPLLDGTLDQCLQERITPQAWSPLGGGRLLAGKGASSDVERVRGALEELARQRGVSPAALALAWLLRHPAGIMPIVGSTKPERIRECAKAAEIELSREEWYRLLEAAYGKRLP